MSFERIHRFAKTGIGSVNTYWIETSNGLIVIDGQRELSSAHEAKRRMDATRKPTLAVFLTHPHPDHFGGIGVFSPEQSKIPVYGSGQTRESIRQDRWQLVKASKQVLGEDFPSTVRLPDVVLSDNQPIEIDGVRIIPAELGGGESECMTVLHLPEQRALFAGDVVQHRMTAFLLEKRSTAWLAQLRGFLMRFNRLDTIYPGHGEPGPAHELIANQIGYIETFQTLVASKRDLEIVVAEMKRLYPGYVPVAAIPDLLEQSAKALRSETQDEGL